MVESALRVPLVFFIIEGMSAIGQRGHTTLNIVLSLFSNPYIYNETLWLCNLNLLRSECFCPTGAAWDVAAPHLVGTTQAI